MKSSQGASVVLAGMGVLKPTTQGAGKHCYEVEFPEGHANHRPMAFFPNLGEEKKATAGNFFGPLSSPKGLKGAMTIVWKCSYKQVHAKIIPQKPLVMTTRDIKLTKGAPALVGGPEDA